MARLARAAQPCSNNTVSRALRSFALVAGLAALPMGVAIGQAGGGGKSVTQEEYDGWRQYSVHCARCHGQDVVGNPVAANLLKSVGEGGQYADKAAFVKIVREGRPSGGMPALEASMTPEQISAVYAYVKGRADKRIPPGRPKSPAK